MTVTMPLAALIEQYSSGPKLIRQAVAGMRPAQISARPIAGKWSTLEVVAHLADFEVIGVDRLTAVIAEEEPVLPGRNEQKYAARLAYDQRDLEEQLRLIELCRSHVTRLLRTLTDGDLSRRGIHSEAGPLTLEQLLLRVTNHVDHHLKFIASKRQALGL
jgi:uncharacterized damage-inducible protein DinB